MLDVGGASERTLEELEEELRQRWAQLPDDVRLAYFREVERRLKDPDTYALLNYLLVGIHHFYLGHWRQGILAIAGYVLGVLLLLMGDEVGTWAGLLLLLSVGIHELVGLFRSQRIVALHNIRVQDELLRRYEGRVGKVRSEPRVTQKS